MQLWAQTGVGFSPGPTVEMQNHIEMRGKSLRRMIQMQAMIPCGCDFPLYRCRLSSWWSGISNSSDSMRAIVIAFELNRRGSATFEPGLET
jgi:hypothetical protein